MRFSEDRLEQLRCSDGVTRTIHVWQPESSPRAVLLAIHGGLAHGGDYVTPARYFKRRGIATVSHDMVGHDRKKRAFVPHFAQFLDDNQLLLEWIKGEYPGVPVFVMGHSMGALIATHLGLKHFATEEAVKGYVLSSPFYVNKVPVSPILLSLSGLLSRLAPKLKVPIEDFTEVLTHDAAITRRHHDDASDHIRGSEMSCRLASELIRAQAQLPALMPRWHKPLFAAVAGDDRLADPEGAKALLESIDPRWLEYHYYADNYHENFNELNREEIFAKIERWLEGQLQ